VRLPAAIDIFSLQRAPQVIRHILSEHVIHHRPRDAVRSRLHSLARTVVNRCLLQLVVNCKPDRGLPAVGVVLIFQIAKLSVLSDISGRIVSCRRRARVDEAVGGGNDL